MRNQLVLGMVCSQLTSLPAGGSGPKWTTTSPSGSVWSSPKRLLMLGYGLSVCNSERVWVS